MGDANGNGEISWEEFWKWWQDQYSRSASPSRSPSPPRQMSRDDQKSVEEERSPPIRAPVSRGVTPSPEVQKLRGARLGRPAAPSRQNAGSLDLEQPLLSRGSMLSRGSLLSRGSSLGNFSVGPKWCESPDPEPIGSRGG